MTPGPWTVHKGGGGHRRSHVIVRGDQIVAWMEGLNNNDCGLDLDDNAALIAAAPELLVALLKTTEQLEMATGGAGRGNREALSAARAAIAKATGGEP
jgi:hypothetical protein